MDSIRPVPIPPETPEEEAARLKRLRKALDAFYKMARSEEGVFSKEYMEEKLANAIYVPPERKRPSGDEHRAPRKKGRSRRGPR